MMSSQMIAASLALLLACCSSQPKDGGGEDQDYVLRFTQDMEFVRGAEGSYAISGHFSVPGDGRISVDGLPGDASYEGEVLKWQPSCDLKPANGQFLHEQMVQHLRINLQSLTTDSVVQKLARMIVHLHGEGSTCDDED